MPDVSIRNDTPYPLNLSWWWLGMVEHTNGLAPGATWTVHSMSSVHYTLEALVDLGHNRYSPATNSAAFASLGQSVGWGAASAVMSIGGALGAVGMAVGKKIPKLRSASSVAVNSTAQTMGLAASAGASYFDGNSPGHLFGRRGVYIPVTSSPVEFVVHRTPGEDGQIQLRDAAKDKLLGEWADPYRVMKRKGHRRSVKGVRRAHTRPSTTTPSTRPQ